MSDDFSTYVENERTRLNQARDFLLAERLSIDSRMEALNNEFAAIDAYHAAKTGKAIVRAGAAAPRARRGSQREAILSALNANPNGMTRGELLEAFGVKGNKSGEGSVSNALNALQKAGQVVRRDGGRWAIAAAEGMRQAAE